MDVLIKENKKMETLSIIKKYWGKLSYADIGKKFSPIKSANSVRCIGRRAGLPALDSKKANKHHKLSLSTEEMVGRDMLVEGLSEETKRTERKYELVCKDLEEAKKKLEAFKVVGGANSFRIHSDKREISEATAVAVLSDVHFAETVESENVNGRNEYNPDVAKKRLEKFFQNLVRLIQIFGEKSHIHNLVLALLGDLINGQLREEAMENNSMRPMEEMLAVKEILSSGIRYILDNTSLRLVIPCHSGNHARTTKKIHVSTEAGNSLEYVLYHSLAHDFKDEKRVKFIIPTSYHSFVDVGGVTIRFHHGHFMRYMGGVGGIYIPVNKAIAQWNKVQRVDLDVFGHYHQHRDGGNFVCNGSVIGWNEYANSIKADYEKPKQAFFLVDHKRKEKTVTAPIFLE